MSRTTTPLRFPRWQDLTSREVAALSSESVAVMVLGAIEQHGAHLPLATDLVIGEGLLTAAQRQLPAGFPLVTLPPMAIGASDEHLSFPGTLSLSPELAIATLEAYGEAVARAGLKRLILINSHGGNKAVMDLAALRLRRRHGLLVVKLHYMRLPLPDTLSADALPAEGLPIEELRHGLHGGAVETAMMHYLAPTQVRLDHLAEVPSCGQTMEAQGRRLGPEGEASFAWLAEDLNPLGVVGNAHLGTRELGEQLVAHYGERIARLIVETAETSLDPVR